MTTTDRLHGSTPSTLDDPAVAAAIAGILAEAEASDPALIARAIDEAVATGATSDGPVGHLLADARLPVSAATGRFLYGVARVFTAPTIIEVGTSFGVSTVHLAAALADGGGGRLVSCEIEEHKALATRSTLDDLGLSGPVTVLVGDARTTLAGEQSTVDLVLLDGWKDGYLEVLTVVEPRLRSGAVVLADDLDLFPEVLAPYLDYVRDPANGYVSSALRLGDGMEISVRLEGG